MKKAHTIIEWVDGQQYDEYKIGVVYSDNIPRRRKQHSTAAPLIYCVEYIQTYAKTKNRLETQAIQELQNRGYIFIGHENFLVPRGEMFSLANLTACKGRKIYKP
jgi:hypothetical protein